MRTIANIDGFNLYHAFQRHAQGDPKQNYIKWVNLRTLAGIFAPPPQHSLTAVKYFSAYATWKPGRYKKTFKKAPRHQATAVEQLEISDE